MGSRRSRRKRRRRRSLDTSRLTKRQTRRRAGRRADRSAARGEIPIKKGLFGGSRSLIARAVLRTRIGKRLATVARQQISRVPGLGRFARTTQAARVRSQGNLGLAVRPTRPSAIATIGRRTAVLAAGGAAIEAGAQLFSLADARRLGDRLGGVKVPRRSPARRGVPFTPGTQVPTDSITHTWVANGVPFAQLADGRVMVRRKNGTIKIFRRPKPIVLGRNPSVQQLVRADKKIDKLLKLVRKRFPPARRNPPRHSQQHN